MSNIIKHFSLTHRQAAEKELILDQIRTIPRGPWVNGNKVTLPKSKATNSGSKKRK